MSSDNNNNVPFPRMGYNLDENPPLSPEGLMNNNINLANESQRAMFSQQTYGENRLNAERNGVPSGMRLPTMSTKGRMGMAVQTFDPDESYESDYSD